MSQRLPALWSRPTVEPEPIRPRAARGGVVRRWVASPLGQALADVAPDLLRFAGRTMQNRSGARLDQMPGLPSSGANGMTVSEVEIDVASPLVRRVTVRTTNAWSIAPEVALARERRGRGGRIGLGALSVAGLAVLGLAVARRSPMALPSRIRSVSGRDSVDRH